MLEDVQSTSGRKINIVVNGVKEQPAEGFAPIHNAKGRLRKPDEKSISEFCTLLLLFSSLAAGSLAQNESLLIGPGDLLHLQVYDTPEMEQRARVTDAGTIPFSFLGNVNVSGLTPEQAAEQIEQRLGPPVSCCTRR